MTDYKPQTSEITILSHVIEDDITYEVSNDKATGHGKTLARAIEMFEIAFAYAVNSKVVVSMSAPEPNKGTVKLGHRVRTTEDWLKLQRFLYGEIVDEIKTFRKLPPSHRCTYTNVFLTPSF